MFKKYFLLILALSSMSALQAMEAEPGVDVSQIQGGQKNIDLYFARMHGDVEGMKRAIFLGANPNEFYANPLLFAVGSRNIPFIEFLMVHGANPNFEGKGGSALNYVRTGYSEFDRARKKVLRLLQPEMSFREQAAQSKHLPRQQ